jgi:pyruvate,water dikinase
MANLWIDGNHYPAPEPPETADMEALRGLPVSPGVTEGEAVVLAGPGELDRMRPGAILVTPVVGPSWTPLLASAAGLVVEMGGMLSHGSILAREYRIPAVANLPGITARLKTGDRVRLDGTNGTVLLLEPAEEESREDRAAA